MIKLVTVSFCVFINLWPRPWPRPRSFWPRPRPWPHELMASLACLSDLSYGIHHNSRRRAMIASPQSYVL